MIARLSGVTYTYPGADAPALRGVDLGVERGELGIVAGPSAGGKSTLLRVFNGLVPQFSGGRLAGHACVAGRDPARTPTRDMATVAGMVFQEPEAQAVVETVEDEIAFGMEQRGVPRPEMERRLHVLLDRLGLGHLRERSLVTLSGGARQRVAIAAVLAMEPAILLLDEPTSQLDPEGAAAVLDAVVRLNADAGLTVLLAEHRLERLLHRATAAILVRDGTAQPLAPRDLAGTYEGAPAVSRLGQRLGLDPVPLTVDEARNAIAALNCPPRVAPPPAPTAPGDELLRTEGLGVRYGDLDALRDVDLAVREGEIVALLGPNGSGKTTLFRALAGLVAPAAGTVALGGRPAPRGVAQRTAVAGLVPQDPALALMEATVARELASTLRSRRVDARPRDALVRWGLDPLADRDPRDLSVGQQQRVAVAAMLAHEPPVWLLDEPTRGADEAARAWLEACLRAHASAGGAAVVATHDVEFAARIATRAVGLAGGRLAFDLPAREAFGSAGPVPTQIAQVLPGALLPEEVLP